MARSLTIVDYGVGNLLSVKRGFEHLGAKVKISSDADVIMSSNRVVLPGVGAFPNGMKALKSLGLDEIVRQVAYRDTKLLAICLGMQLLMDEGDEFEKTQGLGLIPGRVVAIPEYSTHGMRRKIPHIGWNKIMPSSIDQSWRGTLLGDNDPGDFVYFVHSFMVEPINKEHVIANTFYDGTKIPAVISYQNLTGCQFHPEKSGQIGLSIMEKFLDS